MNTALGTVIVTGAILAGFAGLAAIFYVLAIKLLKKFNEYEPR